MEQFLRAKKCAATIRIGLSTWWRWVAEGRVPDGIRLGRRVTVWPYSVVCDLIDAAKSQNKNATVTGTTGA